jgi:hypothetical protein
MTEGMTRIESAMSAAVAHMELDPERPLDVHRRALASMLSDIAKDCDRAGDEAAAETARRLMAMLEDQIGGSHD